MTDFAVETLLAPIEGDSPTGPDLEYDAEFMALDRAATPKAERVMGDETKAAEEPDWEKVADMGTALFARSKDLRAAFHLTCAWLRTGGMPGWNAGLGLIHGLLETYWDGVYPQLDAEDDNDPTARVNAVAPLASYAGILNYFETTPFVQSPRLGRFSLRDVKIANGEVKAPESAGDDAPHAPSMSEIEACCMDTSEEDLAAVAAAVDQSLEHARAIDQIFTDKIGSMGPDLKPLLAEIQSLQKFVAAQVARRNPDAAGDAGTEGSEAADGTAASGGTVVANGKINGPQDVVRRIDDICDYYARAEPSSPVPLLLRRAQRLVGLSFADLMKDLAPGGMSELEVIAGPSESAESE